MSNSDRPAKPRAARVRAAKPVKAEAPSTTRDEPKASRHPAV